MTTSPGYRFPCRSAVIAATAGREREEKEGRECGIYHGKTRCNARTRAIGKEGGGGEGFSPGAASAAVTDRPHVFSPLCGLDFYDIFLDVARSDASRSDFLERNRDNGGPVRRIKISPTHFPFISGIPHSTSVRVLFKNTSARLLELSS